MPRSVGGRRHLFWLCCADWRSSEIPQFESLWPISIWFQETHETVLGFKIHKLFWRPVHWKTHEQQCLFYPFFWFLDDRLHTLTLKLWGAEILRILNQLKTSKAGIGKLGNGWKWRFPKSWGYSKWSKSFDHDLVLKPMVTWGSLMTYSKKAPSGKKWSKPHQFNGVWRWFFGCPISSGA